MGRNAKEIDASFLYDALQQGVTRKEIAQTLGISTPTLSARIADIQKKQGLLLQYRNIQALQLTELQATILENITKDKIEEAPLRDLVLCYKILKEKELVSEGKPSEIRGLVSYLVHLEREQAACDNVIDTTNIEYNDVDFSIETEKEVLPNI